MTLSPFEVERREFGTAPMGYRKRDVDAFVDEVHRSLRELWEERTDSREELTVLKERLTRFEQLEEQLKNTLLLAQDSAEKAQEQARRESELILREAGQKSRDIVHAAHEEKQKLELVLRDLTGAEQEARQRLRAMSGAILSHLDDTEALVKESTGTFSAIVQAHPEATELRSTSVDAVAGIAERAAHAAEQVAERAEEAAELAVEAAVETSVQAERVALDAELATAAAERLDAADEHSGAGPALGARARLRTTRRVDTLGTGVADGETADAFFDAPPTFDPADVAPRERATATSVDAQ
jgi:cell division initiation protein